MPPDTLHEAGLLHGHGLPAGWSVKTFGAVARVANGQVSPLVRPYIDFPHIGPENIEADTGRIRDVKITRELGLVSGKYLFDEKAIIYAKIRPNLNKVCIPGFKGLCSADAYPIWGKPGVIDRDYLAHYMRCELFLRQSIAVSMRTGMPKVNRPDIVQFKVLLPPLDEQIRIATLLNVWDKALDKLIGLIAARNRFKTGLMQQLLTGKRRFKEFVRSNEYRETRFGPVPKDWRYIAIRAIASEVSARNDNNEPIPVLSCTKHNGLVRSLEYFGKQIYSEDTSPYKIVRRGQFAYATNHIEEGSIGILTDLDVGLVSPMYTVFETNDEIHAPFLYALFKTELYRHIFATNTNSSIDRRGSLRWKGFAELPLALPSIEEQQRIAAVLAIAETELTLLRKKRDLLKDQKKGLMRQLLTGQVRVRLPPSMMEAASSRG